MGFPSWEHDLDLSGFPGPPKWTHLTQRALPQTRPLLLASLCIGLDAAGHALQELGVPYITAQAFDTDTSLLPALVALHGEAALRFKLGPASGNLLDLDESTMCSVDAVVAGPPCPPFSNLGKRLQKDDPRAAVFEKVLDVVVEQGRRGCLAFFILENVPGIEARRPGLCSSRAVQASAHVRNWCVAPRKQLFWTASASPTGVHCGCKFVAQLQVAPAPYHIHSETRRSSGNTSPWNPLQAAKP